MRPEKCKSTCEKDEICDENEQCRAPIKCNFNTDCDVDKGEICKADPATGLKICVSPVDLIKVFFLFFFFYTPLIKVFSLLFLFFYSLDEGGQVRGEQ